MKKNYIAMFLLGLSIISFSGVAQAQDDSQETRKRINDAVMGVYNDELEKNPSDYGLLFGRANQYFVNGDYIHALDDVTAALKYTTTEDKATLFDEYLLRAKIYIQRKDNQSAIADLKEANRLNPSDMSVLMLLGDLCLDANDLELAKASYQQMQRLNSVDYNSLAGLAKVAVKEKNYGQAAEFANKAVELYPAESRVYINRSEVLSMMNNYEGAAQDLISALSVTNNTSDALQRLVEMSNTSYNPVMKALSNSIDKAPKVGMFYYIRSMVAIGHNHYASALKDLNAIINGKLYDYHGIYYDCAVANFNLGNYRDALNRVNTAIMMYATNPDYYILKAQIQAAMGLTSDGIESVGKALAINPNYVDALREKAALNIQMGKSKEALNLLNEALLNNSTIAENLILRAWLEKSYLKSVNASNLDYNKALSLGEDINSWRGLALHGLGKDVEAKAWADKLIQDSPMPGGQAYYVAAVVYGQCGDTDTALKYLENAFANGYGSYYKIMDYKLGMDNIAPVRENPRFKTVIDQYKSVFEN